MFLGKWNGLELVGVKQEEYKNLYQDRKLEDDTAYVIMDNGNYVVHGRDVVGQFYKNTIKPNKGNMPAWADVVDFGASASRQTVITERSTVEAIDKSKVVNINDLVTEGKAKLEEIVAESQVKAAAIRKKRCPVKKVVEPTTEQ